MVDADADSYWVRQAADYQSKHNQTLNTEPGFKWTTDLFSMRSVFNDNEAVGGAAHPFDPEIQVTPALVQEQAHLFNEAKLHTYRNTSNVSWYI